MKSLKVVFFQCTKPKKKKQPTFLFWRKLKRQNVLRFGEIETGAHVKHTEMGHALRQIKRASEWWIKVNKTTAKVTLTIVYFL